MSHVPLPEPLDTDRDEVVPRALPKGPHGLSAEVVALSQRRRLFAAIVDAVAESGYAGTTVADIIRRAGVSRTTFYEQFADKEDCFLAAYAEGAEAQFRIVNQAQAAADDPTDRLEAGVKAYVDVLGGQPHFARSFVSEVVAAGPRARALREQAQQRYVDLLKRVVADLRDYQPVDDELILAATAAMDELIVRRIRKGELGDTDEVSRKALYLLFAVAGLSNPKGA